MKICLKCGKTYIERNGEFRYFCSRKCYNEYYGIKKPKKSIKCSGCDNNFIPKTKISFLCDDCKQHKAKTKIDIEKECKICHSKFITSVRTQLCCSKNCSDINMKQNIQKNIKLSNYKIFKRDNFRCVYCGKTPYEDHVKLVVEHVYPRSKGGTNELFNTVTACSECNQGKSNNILDEDIILSIWETANKKNKESQLDYGSIKKIFNKKYKTH